MPHKYLITKFKIMKKLLLVAMMAFGFAMNAQDGQFNVGANFGLPIGTTGDVSSFVLGAEVNYLFEVSDDFKVGPSVSYNYFFGKDVDTNVGGNLGGLLNGLVNQLTESLGISGDSSYMPIAAAARYNVSEAFVLGADLGYAIGISPSANNGGFYYRPMVGYNVAEKIMIQATYSGVSTDGSTASNIGLGVMFGL
ncbi:OMP_b-brl domain-containing protein [Tenacibaculum sp. 190524A02b]